MDLSRYAGRGRELVLETRGFEAGDEPERAFWGAPAMSVPGREAPLAIVYLVDTLRADHTGPYGYTRDTTPELDRLREGRRRVRDRPSRTPPGRSPRWPRSSPRSSPASTARSSSATPSTSAHVTLAEMLHAKGFATGAAIANSVIYSEANFDQGFDYFAGLHGEDDRPSKLVEAAVVVDAGLALARLAPGHSRRSSTCTPWTRTSPTLRRRPSTGSSSRTHSAEHPATDPRTDYKEPLDRERMIAQYDGDVAYGDQEFGRFVRELKARGLYDRALIVFLGDHGEEFQDHGAVAPRTERLRRADPHPPGREVPGADGTRAGASPSRSRASTCCPRSWPAMGLPVPAAPAIAGRPLQAVAGRRRRRAPGGLGDQPPRLRGPRRCAPNGDKYIRRFSPEKDELYFDLAKDPKEKDKRARRGPRARAAAASAGVEAAMVPNPFRYVLRVAGRATLRPDRAHRRLDGERAGDRARARASGRLEARTAAGWILRLRAAPGPAARDRLRASGPWACRSGSRAPAADRPLRTTDVWTSGRRRASARRGPVPRCPSWTRTARPEHAPAGLFKPPPAERRVCTSGWSLPPGRKLVELDAGTRER